MSKAFADQRAQIGVESVTGTAVAATLRPRSGSLTLNPKTTTGTIEPGGEYWLAGTYLKEEHTEGSFEGIPDIREMRPLLDLIYGPASAIEPEPGANICTYQLAPTRPTWTVEYGDQQHTSRAAGVFATGYKLEWGASSGDAKFTVDLVGGPLEDGVEPSTMVTTTDPLPITAADVRVYVDNSELTIGTTQLLGLLKTTVSLSNLAQLTQYLGTGPDQTNLRPSTSVELVAVAGTRVRELRDTAAVRYVRIEWFGPLIAGTATRASLRMDMAVQSTEQARGETDAVYAATMTWAIVAANGFIPTVTLTTDQV
jgi:hypothetical protein